MNRNVTKPHPLSPAPLSPGFGSVYGFNGYGDGYGAGESQPWLYNTLSGHGTNTRT